MAASPVREAWPMARRIPERVQVMKSFSRIRLFPLAVNGHIDTLPYRGKQAHYICEMEKIRIWVAEPRGKT